MLARSLVSSTLRSGDVNVSPVDTVAAWPRWFRVANAVLSNAPHLRGSRRPENNPVCHRHFLFFHFPGKGSESHPRFRALPASFVRRFSMSSHLLNSERLSSPSARWALRKCRTANAPSLAAWSSAHRQALSIFSWVRGPGQRTISSPSNSIPYSCCSAGLRCFAMQSCA